MSDEREALIQEILTLDKRIYRAMQAEGLPDEWLGVDVSLPHLKILFLLYAGGDASMGKLASTLHVQLSTITPAIDRLVEQGLVRRDRYPDDRRLVVASLTEDGFELIDRLYSAGRERIARILRRISMEELRQVEATLTLLYSAAIAPDLELAAQQGGKNIVGNLPSEEY